MDHSSLDLVKQVFDEWSLYDSIIQYNYMRHSELSGSLRAFVNGLAPPAAVIDLGCGDGWLAKNVFDHTEVQSYVGVDLSASALKKAASQLNHWSGRTEFVCQNIADFLAHAPSKSSTAALVSYSLHHFSSHQKLQLLKQIQRVLVTGGHFFWIDLVRRSGEDRDTFLRRMTSHIRNDWSALSPDQTQQAVNHVLLSDFPEDENGMQTHAAHQGLRAVRCLYRDALYGAWAFVKMSNLDLCPPK